MRIDKYIKVARIIKRRTVAQQACEAGRVSINNKIAKPGDQVKIGDRISLRMGPQEQVFEVLSIQEHVNKEDAALLFKRVEGMDGHADRSWV